MNILIVLIQSFLTSTVQYIEKKVVLSGLEVEKVPQAEIDDGLPDDSNLEDDDVDVSEITKRIEKSLSSLDQAEVE